MRLIEEQQRGEFRAVCKSYDYYKSIHHMRMSRRKDGSPASDNLIKEFANAPRAEPGLEKIDAGPAIIVS